MFNQLTQSPPRLYCVSFRWLKTPMKTTEFEPIFTRIGDWIRFNGWQWFVWTSSTPDQIYEAFRTQLNTEDNILIVQVDPAGARGWSQPWIWDWFNSKAAAKK